MPSACVPLSRDSVTSFSPSSTAGGVGDVGGLREQVLTLNKTTHVIDGDRVALRQLEVFGRRRLIRAASCLAHGKQSVLAVLPALQPA